MERKKHEEAAGMGLEDLISHFHRTLQLERVPGKDAKEETVRALADFGLSEEDFAKIQAIGTLNIWNAFCRLIRNACDLEIRRQRKSLKEIERGNARTQKLSLDKFVRTKLGLEDWEVVQFDPWLCAADKAFFLDRIAEPAVQRGHFGTLNNGTIYWSSTNPDGFAPTESWMEGDTRHVVEVARAYKITLNAGTCYVLNNIPTGTGRAAVHSGVQTHDLIVVEGDAPVDMVLDELQGKYYRNCLFRNKITKVTLNPDGSPNFTITGLPAKPAILDEKVQLKFDRIGRIINEWDNLEPGQRKQGLVLYGPPGSGKTASITQLINEVNGQATIFYVSSLPAAFLQRLYPWLESVGPNLVIYEDMDGIQVRRDGMDFFNGAEATQFITILLEVLDGEKEYDVITLATTNHPDHFDAAVLRPGRLGMSVKYEHPGYELKLKIIEYYLETLNLNDHFEAQDLARHIFNDDSVLGSHIASTLKQTAVEIRLGAEPDNALRMIAEEFMGTACIGWQRNQRTVERESIGFGS